MLFNSIEFALFLPIVFILYWFITNKHLKTQNCLLILASYIFYGWWDWRFLFLIFFSSCVDFFIGIGLSKLEKQKSRKLLVLISIMVNISLLVFFKYFNFFTESFANAFTLLGRQFEPTQLNIILPVGISFYTFQTLSYTIDVYKRKIKPTNDVLSFFAFVSFFPQLVAGPIERATNLLPQFYKQRIFIYHKAVDGMRQILWGLFKKVVIADNCAHFANQIFDNYSSLNGSTLVLGAFFFAFQIYGDFSGYSDIAIGASRLFGFDLKQNFSFPYFSRDIAEFWRRWHISLSTWFRDYVYIPIGGSRGNTFIKVRNIFLIFLISGFWHGANWTFIAWGLLNACFFLPLILTKKHRKNLDIVAFSKLLPSFRELIQIMVTFGLTMLGWIFFRAESLRHALLYISEIFSESLFQIPQNFSDIQFIKMALLICCFLAIEWFGRNGKYAIEKINFKSKPIFRYAFYYIIVIAILAFGGEKQEFIYFQF